MTRCSLSSKTCDQDYAGRRHDRMCWTPALTRTSATQTRFTRNSPEPGIVPQHVRCDAFVKTGMACCFGAGIPDSLGGEMIIATRGSPTGKKPGLWFLPPPVLAQCFQQLRAQRHVAVLAALALADVNDHALAVDILHAQPHQFASSNPSGIEQHEDGARLEIAGGINQPSYFLGTEDLRNTMTRVLRVGYRIGRKPRFKVRRKKNRSAATWPTTVSAFSFRVCSRWA